MCTRVREIGRLIEIDEKDCRKLIGGYNYSMCFIFQSAMYECYMSIV